MKDLENGKRNTVTSKDMAIPNSDVIAADYDILFDLPFTVKFRYI